MTKGLLTVVEAIMSELPIGDQLVYIQPPAREMLDRVLEGDKHTILAITKYTTTVINPALASPITRQPKHYGPIRHKSKGKIAKW